MSTGESAWRELARQRLLEWQLPGGGWSYRPGAEAHSEPTALICLALNAPWIPAVASGAPGAREAALRGAEWLAECQGADGSVGLSATLPTPGWPTALALLVWTVLGVRSAEQDRAVTWLDSQALSGIGSAEGLVQLDASLEGWPWVGETVPWLEPTAWAVIALRCRSALRARVAAGVALIADRAVPSGGWNYGNSVVIGTPLRARPAPTGLALLALAAAGRARDTQIEAALGFLESALEATRAPQSLGLGLQGLAAWSRCPPAAESWLEASFERTLERTDPVLQTAYLLLGAAALEAEPPAERGASPGLPALLGAACAGAAVDGSGRRV